MNMRAIASVMVIGFLCTTTTLAGVPSQINYQGTLTDSAGNPINGTRTMTFYIYNDSTGGLSIWNEQHSSVEINDGLFRVVLGRNIPLTLDLFDGTTKWITARIAPEAFGRSARVPHTHPSATGNRRNPASLLNIARNARRPTRKIRLGDRCSVSRWSARRLATKKIAQTISESPPR